jgi:flagellar biosynthesis/type III secretory pathway chaperone
MEKFTEKISHLLQDKLSLYQELRNVLESEKKYVVEMDVDGLWAVTERKKQLVSTIETLIENILAQFKSQLYQIDMDADSFQVSTVINALPLSLRIKSELKKIGLSIKDCKNEISMMAIENKRYITEYLTVIDGIFSTVVNITGKKQYSYSGHILAGKEKHHFIDSEV